MLRHFLPFCTSRRKMPTTFTPWTGKIPPASSTTPPAAPAPVPKDTTSPSPPWAPKPASRPDGPLPVKTEEILSDTQKPLISLHGIRGFIFYFLCFIDSSDYIHPFRRNFARSFIFTTDNIPLLFQVQLGSRCHQAESAYPTIKVTQVFPSSPCLGILFSRQL